MGVDAFPRLARTKTMINTTATMRTHPITTEIAMAAGLVPLFDTEEVHGARVTDIEPGAFEVLEHVPVFEVTTSARRGLPCAEAAPELLSKRSLKFKFLPVEGPDMIIFHAKSVATVNDEV